MQYHQRQVDDRFMRHALALAMKGRGKVEPNPMVGCVLVSNGRIIGEGFHGRFGGPHAEPTALAACSESPAGATAYVTLEPCCHPNKKTPPCAPVLIAAKLARVVVGCLDPNPLVNGKGVFMLREAGIEVERSVLEAECNQLLAPFIARTVYRRPYITMKWAQTSDGKVAGPGGRRMRISNPAAIRVIHQLRARCDAILVGIGTVLADNPMLNAREVTDPRPLRRIVLDRELRTPPGSRLVQTAREYSTTLYCSRETLEARSTRVAELKSLGVKVESVPPDETGELSLPHVLESLAGEPITHLLVEPGPILAGSFIRQNLADRVWITRSSMSVNDASAPAARTVDYPVSGRVDIEGDELTEYLNPASPVFFATEASADLVLVRGDTEDDGGR
jgi:diaminohydroxyphosphoribosylaminopyrimidine deaminase/5-amino-6-(5-phosphoribosylamino)uracil reductase